MSDKPEAYLPLLAGDPESPTGETDRECRCGRHGNNNYDTTTSRTRRFTIRKDVLLLAVIFVQAVAFILLLLAFRKSSSAYNQLAETCRANRDGSHLHLYSPANDILEDQIKVFDDGFIKKNIYQEYSDESDQAWQDLYNRTMMKIPRSEAALLPNRTWPIKEVPGYYIAQLDVFHQLHCVNKVRQALRRDRYDQLLDNPEEEFAPDHLSHCVDSIRQYVMCHSDPSVVFWQWDPKDLLVRPRLEYPHMCKNFEKVRAWAGDRHIDNYIDIKAYVEDDLPPPAIIY